MSTEQQSFFMSYSRADYSFALRLTQDLRAAGARIWLDQLDIELSEVWDVAIEKALVGNPHLLAILSPASVASNNVMDEVSFALEERKIVIPVLYQPCEIPFRLRRLQRMDFTGDYDTALQILVSRLRLLPANQQGHTPEGFLDPLPPHEPPPTVAALVETISPEPIAMQASVAQAPVVAQTPVIGQTPVVAQAPVPVRVPTHILPMPVAIKPIPASAASHPAASERIQRKADIFGNKPIPSLAATLAMIPGLGAVYNRQFRKAGLYLLIYIVLFFLARFSFFALVLIGWIVYMIYESYKTAKEHRDGASI